MESLVLQEVMSKLRETINMIFKGVDLVKLSNYEKRRIIFDYLCNEISYDRDLLDKIKKSNASKEVEDKVQRNSVLELKNVIYNNVGICSSISQYYKLLLERVDIKSYCVICDDGTSVGHQLNLVYDKDSGCYSFDDITSVIVGRGTKDDFFDYDLFFANSVNQGKRPISEPDILWMILHEAFINFYIGRKKSPTPDIGGLPDNIFSIKNQQVNLKK